MKRNCFLVLLLVLWAGLLAVSYAAYGVTLTADTAVLTGKATLSGDGSRVRMIDYNGDGENSTVTFVVYAPHDGVYRALAHSSGNIAYQPEPCHDYYTNGNVAEKKTVYYTKATVPSEVQVYEIELSLQKGRNTVTFAYSPYKDMSRWSATCAEFVKLEVFLSEGLGVPVRLEAENAMLTGTARVSVGSDTTSGGKYVGYIDSMNATVNFTVYAKAAGDYLFFICADGNQDHYGVVPRHTVYANGDTKNAQTLYYEDSTVFQVWREYPVILPLHKGTNTVSVTYGGDSKTYAQLDYIRYIAAGYTQAEMNKNLSACLTQGSLCLWSDQNIENQKLILATFQGNRLSSVTTKSVSLKRNEWYTMDYAKQTPSDTCKVLLWEDTVENMKPSAQIALQSDLNIRTKFSNLGILPTASTRPTIVPDFSTVKKLSDPFNCRDPFIMPYDGKYYLYQSAGASGVRCYVSEDLMHWSKPVAVLVPPANFHGIGSYFWAPECHYYKGNFYIFSSVQSANNQNKPDGLPNFGGRTIGVYRADNPLGPFTCIQTDISPIGWDAIDGTLYVDENGAPWLVFVHEWTSMADGNGSMVAARLSEDFTQLITTPQTLFYAKDPAWATNGVTDGPFLYTTEQGKLLMIWSNFSEKGYVVALAQSESRNILGPWKHEEKLVYQKDMYPEYIYDGGHGMIFSTHGGQLMLVLHGPNSKTDTVSGHVIVLPLVEEDGLIKIDRTKKAFSY